MQTGQGTIPRTMWIGLVATTLAALLALLLCVTGLPDPLVLPALTLLLVVMVAGVVTDVLVRRAWRRTTAQQRAWLSGLDEDLPGYRARVEERERVLFGWESRWWRPLGSAFLVALGAALVPFNLILPLAPDVPVDPLVSAWVTGTMIVTLALVVRAVGAARIDSQGLVLPAPPVTTCAEPVAQEQRTPAVSREESMAKYLLVEEDVAPEIRLAQELQRLTSLLDEPGTPRPVLPVPAAWMPSESDAAEAAEDAAPAAPADEVDEPEAAETVDEPEAAETADEPEAAALTSELTPDVAAPVAAEPVVSEPGAEAEAEQPELEAEVPLPEPEAQPEPEPAPAEPVAEQPPGAEPSEGELDKLAKWFHAA